MNRACRRLVPCLLVLLLCALPAYGELRLSIVGGERDARDNIRAHLGAPPDDEAAMEGFLLSVKQRAGDALEALGIYDYALELTVDRDQRPWRAELSVTHGDPVTYASVDVRLLGAGEGDRRLLRVIDEQAPKVGARLHHGDYESFKTALQRRARERGYVDASFELRRVVVDTGKGTAALELHFATGERLRFGPVTETSALLTPDRLTALLPFAEGDFYHESLLQDLRTRLLHLGYFDSVIVTPELTEIASGRVPISVALLPAPRHSYEVGVGFSTDTNERLSLSWHSPRLNRWGHSQRTRLRYSPVNPSARVTYSIPLDAQANDLLQLRGRLEDNDFGDLRSTQREFMLQREQRRGEQVRSLSLSALREDWELFNEAAQADYFLLGGSWSWRRYRGSVVDPDEGLGLYTDVKLASEILGSEQDLARAFGRLTALRRIGEHSRVVGRVAAGVLHAESKGAAELPPSLAFFAGGDDSLRGFPYQSIGRELLSGPGDVGEPVVVGGSRLLTGSVEYQHYLRDSWRGALFLDAGDAFADDDFTLRSAAGIGLHYLSPLGALRLEIARPLRGGEGDWRLHINIGAEF